MEGRYSHLVPPSSQLTHASSAQVPATPRHENGHNYTARRKENLQQPYHINIENGEKIQQIGYIPVWHTRQSRKSTQTPCRVMQRDARKGEQVLELSLRP